MKQAHIQLDNSINCRYALMPGDPKRIDHIAQYLDNVKQLANNREYKSISGTYKGMPILAISTGMGGVSVAIAIEELKNIGISTMIRIGSCGALQHSIEIGDLVVAHGAIRDEGTSKAYVKAGYPALADFEVITAIEDSIQALEYPYHSGIVYTHESFYIDDNHVHEHYWSNKGALGADMETATLFTVGRLRGIQCGAILNNVVKYGLNTEDSINDYSSGETLAMEGEKREILAALEACYRLYQK